MPHTAHHPTCVLPGCPNPSSGQGRPCQQCVAEFGAYLHAVPGAPMTAGDQVARDDDTRRHYALQLTSPGPRTTRNTGGHAARKANQLCWLCEQRRACTKQQHGWECDTCRSVT